MDVRLNSDTNGARNLLLAALPRGDFARLRPSLEPVPLVPKRVIQQGLGLRPRQRRRKKRRRGVAHRPGGVAGGPALLGVESSPLRHVVRVGGSALRMRVDELAGLMEEMPSLRHALLTYLHVALMQSSQSAACSLRHPFPQRLARWLLTAQDRSNRDELPVTQDLLARTLGVRRATVCEAVKSFERRGVLARLRGLIRIRDRARLERLSCHCYRIIRREQERRLSWRPDQTQIFAFQAVCCLV